MLKPTDLASVTDFFYSTEKSRAGEIRTHDLLHPMQAFYQAELRPATDCSGQLAWQ
jgi:hypothetical protein